MSFLNWFGKKGPNPETALSEPSDMGQVDATVPIHRTQTATAVQERHPVSSLRRNERLERRELLYAVVRESMTAAGILSSTYKFKVLSLDSSGRQYLIMMDMPGEQLADPSRFAEIEGAIARSAKERYDILVTAVYWRINDLVSAGSGPAHGPLHPPHTPHTQNVKPVQERSPIEPVAAPSPYAPIQDEEVLAFKRAVAAAASGAPVAPRGEMVRSSRRNPEPVPDFSDTEPFDPSSPLGPSQFGGL